MANVTVDLAQLEKIVADHLDQTEHAERVDIAFGGIVGIAEQAGELQVNIKRLLKTLGDPALCNGCGAEIWWAVNPRTGKKMPITANALNHFADCPAASKFRKGQA